MKIKYSLAQLIGCVLIISLMGTVLLCDRLIILDLPFTWHCEEWHSSVPALIFFAILCFCSCLLVCFFPKKVSGKKDPSISWQEKISKLINSSCSGNWIDICFLLSFIFYVAWLPDSCSDFVKDGSHPYRFLLYLSALLFMVFTKPTVYRDDNDVNNDKRTLLVTGLSYIKKNPRPTIEPTISPFKEYKKLEKIIVVLSNHIELDGKSLLLDLTKPTDDLERIYRIYKYRMINLYCKRYQEENKQKDLDRTLTEKEKEEVEKKYEIALAVKKDLALKLTEEKRESVLNKYKLVFDLSLSEERDRRFLHDIEEILRIFLVDCIKVYYKKTNFDGRNIEFTKPVDYNNFDNCNMECYDKLASVMRNRYSDENIIVNITAGTSSLTSALTLNAIKGNREMIYVNQNNQNVERANPNVKLIQFNDFWAEREDHK